MKMFKILIFILLAGCINSNKSDEGSIESVVTMGKPIESVRIGNTGVLSIYEIGGCQYVVLRAGYGSDLEHHAGCNNPIHQK